MSHTNTTTNYGLPQFLSSDKPAWMADINVAFADIDSQMKTNADAASAAQTTADDAVLNGAPGYSNLSTYAVGDVVNYLGRVYKCDIAVTTPEAFDNAKWSYYRLSDASAQLDVIDGEIGNTDISGVGDGTITGAIDDLDSKSYREVDHANGGIAWGTQIAYMETVFDALNDDDKRRAIIQNGNGLIVRVADINNKLFNGISIVDSTKMICYTLDLANHTAKSITIESGSVSFNSIGTNINANQMTMYLV